MNKKLLLLNTTINYGSTGKITEHIGMRAESEGWSCLVAHGSKYLNQSSLSHIKCGNVFELLYHEAKSFLLDRHGLGSVFSTKTLMREIESFSPDIIHLHNIHGYWINYPLLFEYLSRTNIPVVWTLHDCWPFTGHCSYFDSVGCRLWKTHCFHCPGLSIYPRSLIDNSSDNFSLKRKLFTSIIKHLTIVPVSFWLEGFVKESFLKDSQIHTIHNGIDINTFSPRDHSYLKDKLGVTGKKIILGVALPWVPRKGLADFIKLANELDVAKYQIVLVGLSEKQIKEIPNKIIGIQRTASAHELSEYYSIAEVFVNPTYEDNFPTTNLEALACGTPVITYRTGGSPEAIDSSTGIVVEKGDLSELVKAISSIDKQSYSESCRNRAVRLFNKDICFRKYLELYNSLVS